MQRFNSYTMPDVASTGKLLFIFLFIVPQLLSCSGTNHQTNTMQETELTTTAANPETFQELGFFGDIKKDKWNDFVQAVRNNISHSRKEQHNIAFNLYQPEDGKLQPIWFERFQNKAAHHYHKKQDYFRNAINVIQQSLAGEAKAITLRVLNELPATAPVIADRTEDSRFVIMLLDVKPEKKKEFIHTMTEAAPFYRQARGNLEFNLFAYSDDPNKFLLIEGWQNRADLEAHWQQPPITISALEGLLVSNPKNMRWILKDISQ